MRVRRFAVFITSTAVVALTIWLWPRGDSRTAEPIKSVAELPKPSALKVAPDDTSGLSEVLQTQLREAQSNSSKWSAALAPLTPQQLLLILNHPELSASRPDYDLRRDVLLFLGRLDPASAVAWMDAHQGEPGVAGLWGITLAGWRDTNFDDALDFLFSRQDRLPNPAALFREFYIVGFKDHGGVPWLESNMDRLPSGDIQYEAVEPRVWYWAGENPRAAAKWILKFEGKHDQPDRVKSVFSQWTRQDPEAAWKSLEALQGPNYEAALDGFARAVLMNDTSEGLALLAQMKSTGRKLKVLSSIGSECALRDVDRGMFLLSKLSDMEDWHTFALSFVMGLEEKAPEKAAALIDQFENRPLWAEDANVAANQWAQKDALAALAWTMKEPDTEARNARIKEVFDGWGRTDAEAAWNYIQQMPRPDERNLAAGAWSIATAPKNSQRAMTVALKLPAGPDRNHVLRNVGSIWSSNDDRTYQAWLKTADLTDPDRTIIIKRPSQPK